MAGLTGVFGYTGYSATTFAVRGFSEALRRELRPFGIRVSVLCPPNTRTPGFVEENRYKPAEVLKAEEKVSTVDPDVVAAALLRQLPSNPFVITASLDSRLAVVLLHLAPWIVDRALRRPDPRQPRRFRGQ
jgi:3-dehydrosphinganine reductase